MSEEEDEEWLRCDCDELLRELSQTVTDFGYSTLLESIDEGNLDNGGLEEVLFPDSGCCFPEDEDTRKEKCSSPDLFEEEEEGGQKSPDLFEESSEDELNSLNKIVVCRPSSPDLFEEDSSDDTVDAPLPLYLLVASTQALVESLPNFNEIKREPKDKDELIKKVEGLVTGLLRSLSMNEKVAVVVDDTSTWDNCEMIDGVMATKAVHSEQ